MRCPSPFLAGALLLTSLFSLSAYDNTEDFLLGEFWVELVPAVRERADVPDIDGPLPMRAAPIEREVAMKRLLEEVRFVFSGMIYGFRLSYTPSDRARSVDESFDAELAAEIPWGDPALRVLAAWRQDDKLYARVRYDLSQDQRRRRAAWASAVHPSSQGRGLVPLNHGYRGRMEAHRQGIKTSFRSYLQTIVRNKPRAVTGRCVLSRPPLTALSAGGYRSQVRIRLSVDALHPYGGE